ncbi:hypothetical protein ABW20_dc0102120 [Dactylellina cionopaga]|nr:hypothetical protein ABW20_dc0102120 [Dactylellina cionopaga]
MEDHPLANYLKRFAEFNNISMELNKVGDTQLYISGMFIMRRPEMLKAANITHVVSVLKGPLDMGLFEPYKHLHIEEDDSAVDNLIQYFGTTNAFIDKAVEEGGGVLIHCAMGISRSATITTAYLIYKKRLSVDDAIDFLKDSRSVVCPNIGFREQLQLYSDNLEAAIKNLNDVPAYRRYLYIKGVQKSLLENEDKDEDEAPTISYYRKIDVQEASDTRDKLKCRKCR